MKGGGCGVLIVEKTRAYPDGGYGCSGKGGVQQCASGMRLCPKRRVGGRSCTHVCVLLKDESAECGRVSCSGEWKASEEQISRCPCCSVSQMPPQGSLQAPWPSLWTTCKMVNGSWALGTLLPGVGGMGRSSWGELGACGLSIRSRHQVHVQLDMCERQGGEGKKWFSVLRVCGERKGLLTAWHLWGQSLKLAYLA